MDDERRCRFCKRYGPIIEGRYMRVILPSEGVVLICDDCHEKGDQDEADASYATWQGTEVEVV